MGRVLEELNNNEFMGLPPVEAGEARKVVSMSIGAWPPLMGHIISREGGLEWRPSGAGEA
jgi:hypothetical protein